jgi:hypothetical protein
MDGTEIVYWGYCVLIPHDRLLLGLLIIDYISKLNYIITKQMPFCRGTRQLLLFSNIKAKPKIIERSACHAINEQNTDKV